jgi:hypothetical protein
MKPMTAETSMAGSHARNRDTYAPKNGRERSKANVRDASDIYRGDVGEYSADPIKFLL